MTFIHQLLVVLNLQTLGFRPLTLCCKWKLLLLWFLV
jgi:hypothetical protein